MFPHLFLEPSGEDSANCALSIWMKSPLETIWTCSCLCWNCFGYSLSFSLQLYAEFLFLFESASLVHLLLRNFLIRSKSVMANFLGTECSNCIPKPTSSLQSIATAVKPECLAKDDPGGRGCHMTGSVCLMRHARPRFLTTELCYSVVHLEFYMVSFLYFYTNPFYTFFPSTGIQNHKLALARQVLYC